MSEQGGGGHHEVRSHPAPGLEVLQDPPSLYGIWPWNREPLFLISNAKLLRRVYCSHVSGKITWTEPPPPPPHPHSHPACQTDLDKICKDPVRQSLIRAAAGTISRIRRVSTLSCPLVSFEFSSIFTLFTAVSLRASSACTIHTEVESLVSCDVHKVLPPPPGFSLCDELAIALLDFAPLFGM